jgi:hypothetical protein
MLESMKIFLDLWSISCSIARSRSSFVSKLMGMELNVGINENLSRSLERFMFKSRVDHRSCQN